MSEFTDLVEEEITPMIAKDRSRPLPTGRPPERCPCLTGRHANRAPRYATMRATLLVTAATGASLTCIGWVCSIGTRRYRATGRDPTRRGIAPTMVAAPCSTRARRSARELSLGHSRLAQAIPLDGPSASVAGAPTIAGSCKGSSDLEQVGRSIAAVDRARARRHARRNDGRRPAQHARHTWSCGILRMWPTCSVRGSARHFGTIIALDAQGFISDPEPAAAIRSDRPRPRRHAPQRRRL